MNICPHFGSLVHTPNGNTFPLPWQLVAPQKAVKCLIFNTIYHVCTCIDRLEQKYMQKSSINRSKNENGGRGNRQGQGGRMDQAGDIKPCKAI
jgi:hypothetical protein